ncbi:glycosyltransferase family 4 protein [Microlunatus ginsengisoli]|uniref:Glycosyltransferase family 4 protein n=1 Tax=Microlunatus ginsengisoli TaxID=363863 RepID=A0ABP6ZDV7_9ACTN
MTESLKIALVLTASTGGIGRHVASLTPRFAAAGHRVRVYAPETTARAHGFAGADVRPPAELRRLSGADVLHAHGYKAGGLAVPVRLLRRTPLVVSWHNAVLGLDRQAAAARLLQRFVARGADLTLGASSDLVQQARWCGARNARLGPVAAPALAAPTGDRDAVRAALGFGPDRLLVLTVSRLAPQKNLGMLLDVAAEVRADVRLGFVVVGDGPERNALQDRIDAERLPVALVGSRNDVPDLLAAADVALLTSTWEARALVAQEALLAGVPLIATKVGGVPELVGDGAVLVRSGDAPAAARALRHLAELPFLRAELAARGRAEAAAWPDEDAVAADVLAAYHSVLR